MIDKESTSTPLWVPSLLADNTLTLHEMAVLPIEVVAVNGMQLLARLGVERVQQQGGVHRFFAWQKTIIAQCSGTLRAGQLYYKSPVDGAVLQMSPQTYCEQQMRMGVDVVLLPRSSGGFDMVCEQGVMGHAVRHVADLPGDVRTGKQLQCILSVEGMVELVTAVERGANWILSDMPYQQAAHNCLYTRQGMLHIDEPVWQCVNDPIDAACACYTCQNFSCAYVHHVSNIGALLGWRLRVIHNITFWFDVILSLRNALETGTLRTVMLDVKQYDQSIVKLTR